jgi:16S rRNA (uracil1498-N3)-methyltransferase
MTNDIGQEGIVIATGPEGGWTTQEIENAKSAGFQPVSLGRRILRAVTAPVVALSLITASCEV